MSALELVRLSSGVISLSEAGDVRLFGLEMDVEGLEVEESTFSSSVVVSLSEFVALFTSSISWDANSLFTSSLIHSKSVPSVTDLWSWLILDSIA